MKITSVKKGSIAENLGVKVGDQLLKINSEIVRDDIDFRFKVTEEDLSVQFRIDGILQDFQIEKDFDDDLGIELEEFKILSCANDCIFCFVDQNPPGMRDGMYFRDGDFRLSYLHGHYVTMTNMSQRELNRIVEQRLSPLFISVHTTDTELRQKVLLYRNNKDDHILSKLKFLVDNNIELHAQVVLMPGINDGAHLMKTIDDLHSFYPGLNSLTIVPVGLTKHREGLQKIDVVTADYAISMMAQLEFLNSKFKADNKRPFIYFSDEWYILSNMNFPKIEYYEPHDLIENGVGQVPKLLDDFEIQKKDFPHYFSSPREFSIVTGKLMEKTFKNQILPFLRKIKNLKINFYVIENDFYGSMVTTTGLLTARDIITSLKGKPLGEAVWTSYRILNDEGTLTLDDMTLEQISEKLGVPFNVSNDNIFEIFERDIVG
tara:strand:- start:4080 stop:5375 length:1296 start_codon:yes stop_codon:yes gene_type:complete